MVYRDSDGAQLNGGSRYQLRFGQPPPVGAFWSVTMYGTPDFFLVANPIGGAGQLAAGPRRDFRPILRMYEPGAAVFDRRYELPPVVRLPSP